MCNYENTLLYQSKLKVNPTLIKHAILVYEFRVVGPIRVLVILESNFKVDSIFHKKNKKINYALIPYANNNETNVEFMTYYLLYVDSL